MAGKIHWLFHVNSPLTYFYPSLNKVFMCCQKNSIMSVFCSNTLISAPECWKYILRGPVFKFFLHFQCLQIASLPHIFFFFAYSKAFATYIILLKTLHRPPKTAILKLKIDWILHFMERNWKLISIMYVPQISLCLVYILRVERWFFLNVFILLEKVSPLD